jgi:hypothetical protein
MTTKAVSDTEKCSIFEPEPELETYHFLIEARHLLEIQDTEGNFSEPVDHRGRPVHGEGPGSR